VPKIPKRRFILVTTTGIHRVNLHFCGCETTRFHIQLLRAGFWPSSEDRPSSAFGFDFLNLFHKLTLQGKTPLYDFYMSILQLSDTTCTATTLVSYIVHALIVRADLQAQHSLSYPLSLVMSQYRHIKMCRRAGRGTDPLGVKGTRPGGLAIMCPACPQPGYNLPLDLSHIPKSKR
jgi:hypothetical protein